MPRIPILKLGSSAETPPPRLSTYSPSLSLEGLQLGIDNIRHDVWLSPSFTKAAGGHIGKLMAKFANVAAVMSAESVGSQTPPKPLPSTTPPPLPPSNLALTHL